MVKEMNRRELMGGGIAAAMGAASYGERRVQDSPSDVAVCRQEAMNIPVVETADVVVCGAGPAGVATALAAARAGATTRLIESNGCLGGVWTAGLLCWILDTKDKPGILQEILASLRDNGAGYVNQKGYSFGYDAEAMKLLLEQMCSRAGVQIRLHTSVVSAEVADGRLKMAVTQSKSGPQAWAGKAFVDATGDGDLAARAGCGFDLGRASDGMVQPMSMMAILTGVRHEDIREFVRGQESDASIPKRRLLAEMHRAGVDPSYSMPTLFRIYDNLFCLAANHEYGCSAIDADDVTEATLHARAEINRMVRALRGLGGIWSGLRLVATNEHIGVREGRRIHGRYTVSSEDLVKGARHEDAVCRTYFVVDVHSPTRSEGKGIARTGVRAKPYDIPLRALIARDVDGLLTAGRCISGDFIAHSSYRVTGNSVALGQAAGVTAALAAKKNCLPHEVPWADIQSTLQRINQHPVP